MRRPGMEPSPGRGVVERVPATGAGDPPRVPAIGAGDPPPEHDTPAEVDATFRTQRRIAVGHFVVFVVVTLTVPLLAVVLDWWSEGQLLGSLSPNFVMVAVGLYAFFFAVGLAAASLATAVEERMLGGPGWPEEADGEELPE